MKPYLVTICVAVLLASSALAGSARHPVISDLADQLIESIDAAVKQKRDITETVGAAPFLGYHYPVASVSQYSLSPSSASVHSYSINYPKVLQSRQVFQPGYAAGPASLQIPIPVYAERFPSSRAIPLSSYTSSGAQTNLLTSFNANAFGLRSAIATSGLPRTSFVSGGWHPVVPATELETPALGVPSLPTPSIQSPQVPALPMADLQAPSAPDTPAHFGSNLQADSFRLGSLLAPQLPASALHTPGLPSSALQAPGLPALAPHTSAFQTSAVQSSGAAPPDLVTLLQQTPDRPPLPPSYIVPAVAPTPTRQPQHLRSLSPQSATFGGPPDLRTLLQQTPDRPPLPPSYIVPAVAPTPSPSSGSLDQQAPAFEAPAFETPAFEAPAPETPAFETPDAPDFPSSDIDTADLQSSSVPNNDLLPPVAPFQNSQISNHNNNPNNNQNNLAQPTFSSLPPLANAQGIRVYGLVKRPKNYYLPVARPTHHYQHHHQPLIHSDG